MIAFVLGNGLSRQSVSVDKLQELGTVYGCNALYRTHAPAVLVAVDQAISREIQDSGYSLRHRFYTRRPNANSGANAIPKPYFGFSSGPVAVGLACDHEHQRVYLLGFDLGPNDQGKFNNLYAGTTHYKPTGALPTYTGNWAKQLSKIVSSNLDKQFIRVVGETTAEIAEFGALENLSHLPLDTFVDRINMQKDL